MLPWIVPVSVPLAFSVPPDQVNRPVLARVPVVVATSPAERVSELRDENTNLGTKSFPWSENGKSYQW